MARMQRRSINGALPWLMVLLVVAAFALAVAWFGWPKDSSSAGGFAEFVGALLSPATLVVLVLSLNAQESTDRRATDNHFTALQVQALIALIEDDRHKLNNMAGNLGNSEEQKKRIFMAILKRKTARIDQLNELLRHELKMPLLASGEENGVQ